MPPRKKEKVKEVHVSPVVRRFQLTEKVCPACGKTFMGTKTARYDTVACRQKANYDRHSTDYLEAKREKYQAEKGKK
jgi:hypothetical protein